MREEEEATAIAKMEEEEAERIRQDQIQQMLAHQAEEDERLRREAELNAQQEPGFDTFGSIDPDEEHQENANNFIVYEDGRKESTEVIEK